MIRGIVFIVKLLLHLSCPVCDGHSEIGVTLDVYTHLGLEDAAAELHHMEEMEYAP